MYDKNMVGETFSSLGQRAIYPLLATYPAYHYNPSCGVSEIVQQQSYKYMNQLLQMIFNDPSIINIPYFPDSYDGQGDRKEFLQNYSKVENKLYWFIDMLADMGVKGKATEDGITVPYSLKLKQNTNILETIGLTVQKSDDMFIIQCPDYPGIFLAWGKLATQIYEVKTRYLCFFIQNKYEEDYCTNAEQLFSYLVEDPGVLRYLDKFFLSNGYSLICHMGIIWKKIYPHNKRIQFQVKFSGSKKQQLTYSIIMPEIRNVLDHFDDFNDELQQSIVALTNACYNCRFCIQTDKSKEKEIQCKSVVYRRQKYTICTLFPIKELTAINKETAIHICQLLAYVNNILT